MPCRRVLPTSASGATGIPDKNIDEKSYITYESEPEKITSEERAKVQKGAVTINNIQIENKNFDVNILSKLLDKVTCNKDEVLKQLAAK